MPAFASREELVEHIHAFGGDYIEARNSGQSVEFLAHVRVLRGDRLEALNMLGEGFEVLGDVQDKNGAPLVLTTSHYLVIRGKERVVIDPGIVPSGDGEGVNHHLAIVGQRD